MASATGAVRGTLATGTDAAGDGSAGEADSGAGAAAVAVPKPAKKRRVKGAGAAAAARAPADDAEGAASAAGGGARGGEEDARARIMAAAAQADSGEAPRYEVIHAFAPGYESTRSEAILGVLDRFDFSSIVRARALLAWRARVQLSRRQISQSDQKRKDFMRFVFLRAVSMGEEGEANLIPPPFLRREGVWACACACAGVVSGAARIAVHSQRPGTRCC